MPERPKVLVAAQDEISLTRAFREAGWEVVTAADAQQAYNVARRALPAAAVIDYRLGRGGALTVLKWLKSSVHTAATQVVVLAPADANKSELLAAGAQQCLPLPVDPVAICAAVKICVGQPSIPALAPTAEIDGSERLKVLGASGLLDPAPHELLDKLTRLASKRLAAPVALLSLVDKDRQFFKSQTGLQDPWASRRQTPLTHSFCQWVVSGKEAVIVDDARRHPVLRHNLAIRDLGVIAYAGVPVKGHAEHVLGSFCAIDSKPRAWSGAELDTLRDLASVAEAAAMHAQMASGASFPDRDQLVVLTGAALGSAVRLMRTEPRMDTADQELLLDCVAHFGANLAKLAAAR